MLNKKEKSAAGGSEGGGSAAECVHGVGGREQIGHSEISAPEFGLDFSVDPDWKAYCKNFAEGNL